MIGPRKKRSIAKKRQQKHMWMSKEMKRLHQNLSLVKCAHCAKYTPSHRVCGHCGWYKGKQIITIKGKKTTLLEA